MKFAGLQKTSLIDFPGRVSCVVFMTGCNFTCPYCHNPELARGQYPTQIPQDQFLAFLAQRRKLLDGVVITGGEPTLYKDLPELCQSIRHLGLAVKLDTNGSHPDQLALLLQADLVDYIAMDIKTVLHQYLPPLCDQHQGHRIAQSIELIMASKLDYEFRTTCVRPFIDQTIITEIAQTIQGARQYVLQSFQPSSLLQPGFFDGSDPGYTAVEMEQLQASAKPWVQRCIIR